MENRKILIDTNIFLEILLNQQKASICLSYLQTNRHSSCISDFSLHSIGLLCNKRKLDSAFVTFLNDILPLLTVLSIEPFKLSEVIRQSQLTHLDFDDSYQYTIALQNNLTIVTLDQDFKKVQNQIKVHFL
jgi:predicted nucleic acid-binding protein